MPDPAAVKVVIVVVPPKVKVLVPDELTVVIVLFAPFKVSEADEPEKVPIVAAPAIVLEPPEIVVISAVELKVLVPPESVPTFAAPATDKVPDPETSLRLVWPSVLLKVLAPPEMDPLNAPVTVVVPPVKFVMVATPLAINEPLDIVVIVAAPVEVTVAPEIVPIVEVPPTLSVAPERAADELWKLPVTPIVPALRAVVPEMVRLFPKVLAPVPVKLVAVTA